MKDSDKTRHYITCDAAYIRFHPDEEPPERMTQETESRSAGGPKAVIGSVLTFPEAIIVFGDWW